MLFPFHNTLILFVLFWHLTKYCYVMLAYLPGMSCLCSWIVSIIRIKFVFYTLIPIQYLAQRRAHNNHYSLRKGDTVLAAGLHVVIVFTICLITLSRNSNLESFSSAQKSKTTHFGGNFQKFLCILFITVSAKILSLGLYYSLMTLHFGSIIFLVFKQLLSL